MLTISSILKGYLADVYSGKLFSFPEYGHTHTMYHVAIHILYITGENQRNNGLCASFITCT